MTALVKNKQTTHEIGLKGQSAILDLTGAMYLADHDVLLVADLHFEKGSSFARRGPIRRTTSSRIERVSRVS